MFEKEGIRYALEETIGTECLSKPIEDFHFIDLADEQQEKAQCWKDGAELGYNKANEWHKADEKPKVTKEYLVYLISGYNCRSVNMMIYNAERGFWCADNQNDVVYWKEIVLPEIKESE